MQQEKGPENRQPTPRATSQPASRPTSQTTSQVSSRPISQPASCPTSQDSSSLTSQATSRPTSQVTSRPTLCPTSETATQPVLAPVEKPVPDVNKHVAQELATPPRVSRVSINYMESYSPPAATPVPPLPTPQPVTIICEVDASQSRENLNSLTSDMEQSTLTSEPEPRSLTSDTDVVTSDMEQSTLTSDAERQAVTLDQESSETLGVETSDLEMGRRMSSSKPPPGGLVVTALSGPDKELASKATPATSIFKTWLTQSFGGRSVVDVLPTLAKISGRADQLNQEKAAEAESQDGGGDSGPRKVEDAISYVNEIKTTYKSSPRTFNKFLCLLRDFKLNKISLDNIMREIKELFKENPHLIKGFDQFLPANKRAKPPPAEVELDGNKVTPADMFCLMFYGHESPSLPLLQPKPPTIGRYDYPEIENSYATRSRPVWGTEENLNKGYSDSEEDEYWKSMGYPLKRGRGRPPQHGRGRPLGFKTTSSGQLSGSGRGRGRGRGVRSGQSKLPKTPLFLGEAGRKAPDSIGGIPLTPGQKATWAATQANLRRGRMSKLEREKELEQRRKERLLKKQRGFKRRGRPPKKKAVKLDSSPEVKSPGEKSSEPKSPQPKSPEPESPLPKSPKPTSQEPTSQEPTSPGPRDSESDQNTDIDIEENNETTDSFLGVAPGSKIACQEPNDNKQDDEDTESQTTLMADSSASLSSLEQIGIRTSESDTEFVEVDEETGSGESDHSKTKKGTTAEARTKVVVSVSEKDCDTRFSSQTDQEIDNELRPGRKIVFKKKKTDSETDCEGRLERKELKQKDAKPEKNKKTSNLNKSSKPGSKKAKKFEDSNNSSDNPETLEKQVSQDDEIKSLPENKELQEDMEVVESLDEQCANIVNTVEAEYQQSLKLKKTRMEKYLARKAEKKKKRSSRQNVLIHKTFKSSVPYVQHLDSSKPLTNLVSLDQVVVEDFHVKVLDQHNLPQKAEHDLPGLAGTSFIAQSSACTSALAQGPAAYQFSGIVRNSSDMDEMTTSESSTLISESDESHPSSSPSQQGTSGTGTVTQGEEAEEEEQQEKERYSDSDEEEEEEVYYGAFSSEDEAGDGDDDDDDYVPHSQLARHYSMPSQSRGRGRGARGNRGRGSGSSSSWKSRGRNGQSQYGQQDCSSSESLHLNSQGKSNKLGKMRKGIHNVSIVPDGARDRITASKVQPAGNKASVIPHDGKERVNYKDLMSAPFASFAGLPTMEQLFRTCGNREEICIEMMYKMTDRSNGADSDAEDDDGCQEGSGSGTEVEEQEEVYEVDENTGQLVLQQRTITKTSSHGLSNPTTVTQGSGQSVAPPSTIQHQRIVSDVAKDSDSEHLITDDVNKSSSPASASWKTKQDIAFGAQSPRACGHSLFKLPSIPPSVQLSPRINNSKVSQKDSARCKELQPKHQKIFCCSLCSETFLNRSNLANHNRSRHASLSMTADQSIQCKLCGERPPDVDSTVRHMAEHAHGKLVCPECPVRCANIESLNSHIRKHDGVLGHQTDVNKNLVSTVTAK